MINGVSVAASIVHPIVRVNYRLRRYFEPIGAVVVFASLNRAGGASPLMIGLLLLWAVAWPHVAYLLARGSNDKRAEHRNMLVDSLMMGAWTAAIHFSLWPSVLLISAVTNSNLGVGGTWLFVRGLAGVAIGLVGVAQGGWRMALLFSQLEAHPVGARGAVNTSSCGFWSVSAAGGIRTICSPGCVGQSPAGMTDQTASRPYPASGASIQDDDHRPGVVVLVKARRND